MGDVAMEKMTQPIIDNQTLAVDTISGATLTSMAFLTAVGSALDAMGESADDWKNREPAAWVSDVELPERGGRRGHRRGRCRFRGGHYGGQ